jgi:hypothetical protein
VEIFGFAHVRLAYCCIIFVYRGTAMAAVAILFSLHARVNSAVLLIISGYDKDPRQGLDWD